MSDIGFNDNLEVAGRKFHFQTATQSGKGKIRCEIFENGRVLSASEVDFERRKGDRKDSIEDRLRTVVESLHEEMISEIELLFKISEKVNKLKHSPSNLKIGIMFLQNNMIEDAIKQFKKAIEYDADYTPAYNHLGLTYIKIGEFKKAIETYEAVIHRNGQFTDMFNNYGLALLMDNRIDEAQEQFKRALRLNRNYLEAHYNMALMYLRSTRLGFEQPKAPPQSVRVQRAFEHLEVIRERKIKVFEVIYDKVQKNLQKNNIEQAIQLLEEGRNKIFPTNISNLISTNFYLKFMYGGKGLDNETIKRFERRLNIALEGNPDYADIWNNLGVIHLIQCRNLFLQALNEFNRALELNPGFEKAIKNKKLVENDGKEFLILLRAILK
jgi:tetratricopeptide (TPR) repeat protein